MNNNKRNSLKNTIVRVGIPALLMLGIIGGLTYKPKAQAISDRGKKVLGVAVGAALMGATAGAAGGAKWVPLGLFGGGLTGGLITRSAVKKDYYEKLEIKKENLERKLQTSTNQKRREALQKQLNGVNQKLQARNKR